MLTDAAVVRRITLQATVTANIDGAIANYGILSSLVIFGAMNLPQPANIAATYKGLGGSRSKS